MSDRRTPFLTAMKYLTLLTIFISFTCIGRAESQDKGRLTITRVGLDKKSFNPSKSQTVVIGFEVTTQADVQLTIYDRLGREVKSFDRSNAPAGKQSFKWDGRNMEGKLAPGEVFLYVIEAKIKSGGKVIHNPANKTGGIETKSLEYTLDRETGKIEFVLPKTCMIRIRAGLKDGMFGNLLFDWKPTTAGRHTYDWDGRDSTGQMYMLKRHELNLRLTTYSLPTNTIITTGDTIPIDHESSQDKTLNQKRQQLWGTKGKYRHYSHDPFICHQPRFKVMFPSKSNTQDEDASVVSGVVPIRIELDPRDERHLIRTRYEIMLFVDGVFIYEIEEGSSPFTFNWDTKDFGKGPHIITVNLIAYDDHIGFVSHKVILGD